MLQVNVELKERRYPITIGAGLLGDPNSYSSLKAGDKVMIVSNPTVAAHYLATVTNTLNGLGCSVDSVLIPDGEKYKTLDSLNMIFTALLEKNHNRDTMLIALGGGVIGDVAGYAAASYQRGIRFIQIPTTLLAQVDSSVGGKTAVNHPLGKNMIGAFYQPISVIIDTNTLQTLPKREVSAGLAEVIKYGAIFDIHFFEWLESNIHHLVALKQNELEYCIQRCCQLKADVVARDETEKGDRALLNLGHTFGHAIEAHLGYGNWLHGEAVSVGMLEAAELSRILGDLSAQDVSRLERLLAQAVLPTISPDGMEPSEYLPYMWRDKKVLGGQLRLVLLKSLGKAYVTAQASEQQVLSAIERFTQREFHE
ncbi:3-dehydroquinate synthase [Actinobacillus pleuropneumoniae]|uniref:3-dehydroquinate synthase n=1 Tax=Actinobacillus pleuropneumoniae TaxID=715 RepID=UPI001EECF663|nr:3-dehydroquinate synthase [Actinobacillus pleuropneumoniae]UKH15779.1 3-dehydroquinate synthase [Actinobacillus pleuropneumoniae]